MKDPSVLLFSELLSQQRQCPSHIWHEMLHQYSHVKADKFSIVSNFGYTKHYFDLEEFQKDRNIKPFNSGSLMPKTTMGGPFDPLAFTD